jgi:hypothetical protein
MCRRASGAPVVMWVTFERATVEFTRGGPAWRRSSDFAERAFCRDCGSALAWRRDGSDLIDLTIGTFDHPEELPPRDHIWTANAIPWLRIADDLPRHPRERVRPQSGGRAPEGV